MGLPTERDLKNLSEILEAAKLVYVDGKSQRDAAVEMNKSQSEISRMLRLAKKENLINHKVELNIDRTLCEALEHKFPHLRNVYLSYVTSDEVTDDHYITRKLGYEAAEYFMNNVDHGDKFGVSCGRTLNAMVSSLDKASMNLQKPLPFKCRIYALVHSFIGELAGVTSSSIVSSAIDKLPKSVGYAYHIPPPPPPKNQNDPNEMNTYRRNIKKLKKFIESNTLINKTMTEMKSLNIYFVGIGHIADRGSFEEAYVGLHFNKLIHELDLLGDLKKLNVKGEANLQPYDSDGVFLIDRGLEKLKERLIYLPLNVLQGHVKEDKIKIVGIAGGVLKRDAIYAALKAKIFNVLITDSLTARKLVEMKEQEENSSTVE